MVQAIPVYAMSYFKLPLILCRQLEYLTAQFWWVFSEKNF